MQCSNCQSENIEQERKDPCSCHINPPCSACVNAPLVCMDCGYEEEVEYPPIQQSNTVWSLPRMRTLNDLDRSKIDWISAGHTHFSMIKEGYAPMGTKLSEIEEKVKGTFGGRFENFVSETGYFKYIAYTD